MYRIGQIFNITWDGEEITVQAEQTPPFGGCFTCFFKPKCNLERVKLVGSCITDYPEFVHFTKLPPRNIQIV